MPPITGRFAGWVLLWVGFFFCFNTKSKWPLAAVNFPVIATGRRNIWYLQTAKAREHHSRRPLPSPWHPTVPSPWSVPVFWLLGDLGPGSPSLSPCRAGPAWIRAGRGVSVHPVQGAARVPSQLSVVQTITPLTKGTWAPSVKLLFYNTSFSWRFLTPAISTRLNCSGLFQPTGLPKNVVKLRYFSCLWFLKPISQTVANMLEVQSHPMVRYKLLPFLMKV